MKFDGTIKEIIPKIATELLNLDQNKKYSVDIKEYRKKRSLNANSYAWLLMEQIAVINNTSKDEIYEIMLQRYGTLLRDSEDNLIAIPTVGKLESSSNLHLKYHGKKDVNGNRLNVYVVIKGSSEYDTKEMSAFVDGIVSEAELLGIETMTPNELANLKSQWGVKNG